MKPFDYFVSVRISDGELAEGKRPPLCDGCGAPIEVEEEGGCRGENTYILNCLVLDGDVFHSVQCDDCVQRYFRKVRRLNEWEATKYVRQAIQTSLSQEVNVIFDIHTFAYR